MAEVVKLQQAWKPEDSFFNSYTGKAFINIVTIFDERQVLNVVFIKYGIRSIIET